MAAVYAIIPVFIIILCGYLCRRYHFPDDGFWRGAEKITYFLLFPSLLVSKMATANLSGIEFFWPVIVVVLLYVVITIIFVVLKPFFDFKNSQFTSVYQGGMRFNTYIGLAVASSLYGTEGLVLAVIVASIMIPMINICCVLLLEYYSDNDQGHTHKRILRSVITNPLILACLIGMGINLSGLSIPGVIIETLDIFSKAALPLGLLTVGAALVLNSIKASAKPIVVSSISKFFILPTIAMGLCTLFSIEPMVRDTILVFTVLPTATASYVLAKQLGGDYELMATIITVQTLLAGILMPVMVITFL